MAVLTSATIATIAAAVFAAPAGADGVSGTSVFLDPGHNGLNDESISRQVPNGRGGMKDCQTVGTSTGDGYSEHAFNWDIAARVRNSLESMGVHVQMSRPDDASVASCVDQRAAAANAMHPDAIVSIHADEAPPSGRGFHINYSAPPVNAVQSGPALRLAGIMRDALVAAGMQPATYIGSDGLYGRADLAGLNLAEYPAVLVEVGNMRNVDEAAQMESADGRQKYAAAITRGIVSYLTQRSSGG
ncbi:MAG: Rv3717 family N-acetylmuramoyl-L-alanine amidase [Mycobacterium sp.]|nr:Rv3717 family N-acetylmuramoyl-L-alanine amidase [Mycobacterium sp.]